MASGWFDDSSGLSSSDEFGWKVAEISTEKKRMLLDDIRISLSVLSNASSSESSDSEADTGNIQDEIISVDSVSRRKNSSKTAMANTPKNFIAQNSCIVSSSCGTPLQPQEVAGLDLNQFAADSSEPTLFCEDLTADEEVWLLQCPNNVNLQTLKEKMLLSPSSSKITVGQGHVLESSSHSQCPPALTFVLPSRVDHNCRLVVLKPAGQIVIREHVDIPQMTVPELSKINVTFPVGLKMRHPLLGADYEKELKIYNQSMKRLGSHRKKQEEENKRKSNFFEKYNNVENDEKVKKHKKRKLFTENICENALIHSGIPVTSEDFQYASNPMVSKQKKEESSSKGNTWLFKNTEDSNVILNESFSESRKKNKYKSNSVVEENNREHRKRKREGTKSSFETSVKLSEEEHEINIKKKKHEKKRRKLNITVGKAEPEPKDDLMTIESCKRNLAEIHTHTTDIIQPNENSTTDSLEDFMQIEKNKKKKKKGRVSDEEGASTHHSRVIGISVDVEKKSKNEKDRSYRFTIPADFGMKNKTASHRRKLSLNVNM